MNGVLYPSIPKNSSSVWRNRVFGSPGSTVNIDQLPDISFAFAIIRNPHDRLISGLGEWIKRSNRSESVEQILDDFDYYAVWHQSVNDLNFYAHIMPQQYFVEEYDFELFEFTKQNQIATRLAEKNLKVLCDRVTQSVNVDVFKTHEFVDDERTQDIVKRYYQKDVELWMSCQ
jgi:hypothetical protein